MEYEIRSLSETEGGYLTKKLGEYLERTVPTDYGTADSEEIVLAIRDDAGSVIAGCIVGIRNWRRAVLEKLWADERCRTQGLGSLLLREAERTAKEKGCCIMCLATGMARPFYEKHGYSVFSVVKDFPKGHMGYSLMKRLDTDTPNYVPSNNGAAAKHKVECGTDEDARVISRGLYRFSVAIAPDEHDEVTIGRKIVDKDNRFIAGIVGEYGGWRGCCINVVWVEEAYRNQGLGSYLLNEVEREAKKLGAYVMFADAGDWNDGFFKKNGYTVRGKLEDYPKGHCCYELEKRI